LPKINLNFKAINQAVFRTKGLGCLKPSHIQSHSNLRARRNSTNHWDAAGDFAKLGHKLSLQI